jgi:hypothetical protein
MPTRFGSPIMIVENSDENYGALIWAPRPAIVLPETAQR